MTGVEMPDEIEANPTLLARLEAIRIAASLAMGIAKSPEEAKRKPSIPKVAMVTGPREARTLAGEILHPDAADVTVRMMSQEQPHRAVPLTGAMCLAVAARIPGTLVHKVTRKPSSNDAPGKNRATLRPDPGRRFYPERKRRLPRRTRDRLPHRAPPNGRNGLPSLCRSLRRWRPRPKFRVSSPTTNGFSCPNYGPIFSIDHLPAFSLHHARLMCSL